jgi:SHS2 domain-containing protein
VAEQQKFREIDHSSDIAVEVYGSTLGELFNSAFEGLLFLALDKGNDKSRKKESGKKKIQLEASSPEELLVDFLNEILFLINAENIMIQSGKVTVKENYLEADLSISRDSAEKYIKQEIKAATYHNLDIIRRRSSFKATVFFDT